MTIYKPVEQPSEPTKAIFGVKFSNDIFLMKSFLDQKNIEYKDEDLEMTPLGLAHRIKRDEDE